MTSDGIEDQDWEPIKELSAQIANSTLANNTAKEITLTGLMHKRLDDLVKKYGPLPTITATKAEYTEDAQQRKVLFERAWLKAKKIDDRKNIVMIASSLAELFIDQLRQADEGAKWLDLLEESLEIYWDDDEYQELIRLRASLRQLEPPSQ